MLSKNKTCYGFGTNNNSEKLNYVLLDNDNVNRVIGSDVGTWMHELSHLAQKEIEKKSSVDASNNIFCWCRLDNGKIVLAYNSSNFLNYEVEAYKIQYCINHDFPGIAHRLSDINATSVSEIKNSKGNFIYKKNK